MTLDDIIAAMGIGMMVICFIGAAIMLAVGIAYLLVEILL